MRAPKYKRKDGAMYIQSGEKSTYKREVGIDGVKKMVVGR